MSIDFAVLFYFIYLFCLLDSLLCVPAGKSQPKREACAWISRADLIFFDINAPNKVERISPPSRNPRRFGLTDILSHSLSPGHVHLRRFIVALSFLGVIGIWWGFLLAGSWLRANGTGTGVSGVIIHPLIIHADHNIIVIPAQCWQRARPQCIDERRVSHIAVELDDAADE